MLISIKISRNLASFVGSDKSRMLFFPLINVKMTTIVVEHEKSFINSGPVCLPHTYIAIPIAIMKRLLLNLVTIFSKFLSSNLHAAPTFGVKVSESAMLVPDLTTSDSYTNIKREAADISVKCCHRIFRKRIFCPLKKFIRRHHDRC